MGVRSEIGGTVRGLQPSPTVEGPTLLTGLQPSAEFNSLVETIKSCFMCLTLIKMCTICIKVTQVRAAD